MIRKVNEVDPIVCPRCGGQMKLVVFIMDFQAVDCIIDHLKLVFVAEKPPPSRVFEQVGLMAAEAGAEYFWLQHGCHFRPERKSIVFRAISWPSGTMIRPTGLLRGQFTFLTRTKINYIIFR